MQKPPGPDASGPDDSIQETLLWLLTVWQPKAVQVIKFYTVQVCGHTSAKTVARERQIPQVVEVAQFGRDRPAQLQRCKVGEIAKSRRDGAAGHGGPRFPWAILNGAATSFVSPNILRQRRVFLRQGRRQPLQKAPAAVVDSGGPLVCARIFAMQEAVQFGMRAQRELSSVPGGTAASPPLVVVEL